MQSIRPNHTISPSHSSTKTSSPTTSTTPSTRSRPDSAMSTDEIRPISASSTSPSLRKGESFFPLFRLPRELRDRIYSLVLVSPVPITWPSAPLPTRTIHPTLLRGCRQLCDEAAEVLYKENTLQFSHPSDANMFVHLTMLPHAGSVTKMHLPIRDKDARLWFSYFSSTSPHRSLMHDYPNLKSLEITFFSIFWQLINAEPVEKYQRWPADPRLRELCLQLGGRIPSGCVARVRCVMNCLERELVELLRVYPQELAVVSQAGESLVARRKGWSLHDVEIVLELRVEREMVIG